MMRAVPCLLALVLSTVARAGPLRVDAGLTVDRFEQQVKAKIGEPAGERLVEQFQLGLALQGTWALLDWLDAGLYVRLDGGERALARFSGFDDAGRTVTSNRLGGAFTEVWVGPLVRASHGIAFVDIGYGAIGLRWDDARDDLPGESGATDTPLRTHAGIAWLANLGLRAPLTEALSLTARLEYRVRYYVGRVGEDLKDSVDHGTQNYSPFIGVAWTP